MCAPEGGGLTRHCAQCRGRERERRTEKDDRRKEVGLAPVYRLLSGNTYGDQGGEKEEEQPERNRTKKEKRCTT